ncbi:MAG TPA: hypothetical protein VEX37_09540 [Thermomicrobiales bacterium]|nr:hypothetical protein [Thermomicrobiales bacterium]
MRWLVVLLTIVLTSGCSAASGSGGGEDVPQRNASDLATVRAQAGLGPETPTPRMSRPTPTATSTRPTATVETRERNPGLASDDSMHDTLLEPREIATTWTRSGYDGYGTMSYCGAPAIDEQFAPLGWAYGSYSSATGEWAEQWVIRLSEADAQAAMDYARSALTCDQHTFELGGGNDIYWGLDTLNVPAVGDDVYAQKVNITFQNPVPTPQFGNIIFARQGEFVVVVFHYGFRIDPVVSEKMAAAAVARLGLVRDSSV